MPIPVQFKALWARNPDNNPDDFKHLQWDIRPTTLKELSSGDVVIAAEYSGINFKDALALTGTGKILRKLPLVPGVDVSGTVVESQNPQFKSGDKVLVQGCQMGEMLCGGFAQYVRAPGDIVLPLPKGLTSREAMILGTAGFTAALAIHQLEKNGLHPARGEVLVTGATGGVGSIALSLLNGLGYEAVAWTRRQEHTSWLHECGAHRVECIADKDWSTRSLESVVWAGAIDNVGGKVLSYILPRVDLWGSVASIGLTDSEKLESTVFPMILRGVNLLGVSSNNCPQKLRESLWQDLGGRMRPSNFASLISSEVSLDDILSAAQKVRKSQHHGRVLVRLKD